MEESEKARVLQALLDFVLTVKSQILAEERNEEDYPVSLAAAVTALNPKFRESGAPEADHSEDGAISRKRSRGPIADLLRANSWDRVDVLRKVRRQSARVYHEFFLPGDEVFTELPATRKAFLKALFQVERRGGRTDRSVSAPMEAPAARRPRGLVPADLEKFEAEAAGAFGALIKRSRGATYVTVPDLRREMSLDRSAFDEGLSRMRDTGKAILSKHGNAGALTDRDREDCLEVGGGERYYYVELLQSGPALDRPEKGEKE